MISIVSSFISTGGTLCRQRVNLYAVAWLMLAAVMALGILTPRSARAEVSAWQDIPNGRARLLSTAGDGGDTLLGLEIDLAPGWKIYWEYAGPVGQPTDFVFAPAASQAGLFLPIPIRSELQGFQSYGYEGRLVFPGYTSLGEHAAQGLEARLSICSQTQCIPHRQSFELPQSAATSDPLVRRALRRAFDLLPVPSPVPRAWTLELENQTISLDLEEGGTVEDFLLIADGQAARAGFFLDAANLSADGQRLVGAYAARRSEGLAEILGPAKLVTLHANSATVHDPSRSESYNRLAANLSAPLVNAEGQVNQGEPLQAGEAAISPTQTWMQASAAFWRAAAFLFLGGLLLNVMPCVLPVLFIKLKSVLTVSTAQGARGALLRQTFGWTALGILATFAALGLILAIMSALTGYQLTLGVWMQFPITTGILTALVSLFIANSMGWFEFVVPSRVASLGTQTQGPLSHVLAGVVAALLGGACAGALLATSLGVAFTQPAPLMVLLLTIMGLGLALPYILVALIPQSARLLPKPGAWMVWLKYVMAAGLALTLAYLFLIASTQLTPAGLGILITVSLGAIAWLMVGSARAKWGAIVALASLMAIAPIFAQPPDLELAERDFAAEIRAKVAAGGRVLVDVTAYWCATCQTNKLWVLNSSEIQTLMAETQTELLTIDAADFLPNISEFVASHQRASLPLNVFYSPSAPDGLVLPSVLTKKAVREMIRTNL